MNYSDRRRNIMIIVVFTLILIFPVRGDEQSWDNVKSITAKGITITAPIEFQTCVISPDGGNGWDTCTAYIIIKNNKGVLNPESLQFDALWKKNNVRNVRMEYTKTVSISDKLVDNISVSYAQFNGLSSQKPLVTIGEQIGIKIIFEKERWQRTSFDFRGRFDIDEMLLDPDVSECGTLNSAGATYTLINNISSTGTCLTISANNIVLDGAGYNIYYAQTGVGSGILLSGTLSYITIKNANILQNGSYSVSHGIRFENTATSYSIVENNTIIVSKGNGFTVSNTNADHNIIRNNSISCPVGTNICFLFSDSAYGININNTIENNSVVTLGPASDYYLQNIDISNRFIDNNFSDFRKINLLTSYYNYSNNSGNTWVITNLSAQKTVTRKINNWAQNRIVWEENITSGTVTAFYDTYGLYSNKDYIILIDDVLNQTLSTDGTGQLPLFNVSLTTTTQTIEIQNIPSQVTGLTGSSHSYTTINLTWTANTEPDLWGYQVFRDGSSIGYTQNNYFNDTGLSTGTHQYVVRANNTYDNWGVNSSTLNIATGGVPIITSWNNTVTGDATLYTPVDSGTAITFNVLAYTGTLSTYHWTDNGVSVGGNNSFYSTTYTWSSSGPNLHYVLVYGDSVDGTSNIIEWRISIRKTLAAVPISTVNQSAYDSTYASVEALDVVGFIGNVMTQYTGTMGNYVYLFIWVIIFVMIWIRQGSITVPSTLGLLFGVVIIAMLPEQYQIVAQFMIAMGGIAVLYVLFSER